MIDFSIIDISLREYVYADTNLSIYSYVTTCIGWFIRGSSLSCSIRRMWGPLITKYRQINIYKKYK